MVQSTKNHQTSQIQVLENPYIFVLLTFMCFDGRQTTFWWNTSKKQPPDMYELP